MSTAQEVHHSHLVIVSIFLNLLSHWASVNIASVITFDDFYRTIWGLKPLLSILPPLVAIVQALHLRSCRLHNLLRLGEHRYLRCQSGCGKKCSCGGDWWCGHRGQACTGRLQWFGVLH